MDFEFDKEIDVLLRQTARNGDFVSNNIAEAHLDADEIAAFAENALPEKTRQNYMRHLADCDGCRKSLSNLIALNSEFEPETIYAEEKQFVAPPIPWYRRLFAFPNLAYTLGALVVIFSGIAAFTVLQSVKNPSSSEVSQISDKQPNGKGMSSDGTETPSETYSSNSQMAANTAASNSMSSNTSVSNAASMTSISNSAANISNPAIAAAPTVTANSNAAISSDKAEKDSKTANKPVSPAKEPTDLVAEKENSPVAGAAPPPAPVITPKENNFVLDGELSKQQNQTQQNSIAQNQTQITPDSRNVQRVPMSSARAEGKNRKTDESRDDADDNKLKSAATTTTSVGGKNFKRENNVWYDTAYRGQATKNVTRGTNEYKKLDSGLRGIAENLGGTVVIVWKQKAYRIQ